MKKSLLYSLIYVVSMVILLISCEDNKEKDQNPYSGLNGTYSNKLSAPDGSNALTLTYNGEALIGKDVAFTTDNGKTADILLKFILPHDPETKLANIPITEGTNGYSFDGITTSENGTAFRYTGNLQENRLSIELSGITLPGNQLSTNKTWYIAHANASYYNVDNGSLQTLIGMLYNLIGGKLVGNLISTTLDNLTFETDGNIIARYAPLPDSLAIGALIGTYIPRTEAEWKTSPINMATYYVENDLLYVTPQIDMIIHQVMTNKLSKSNSPGNTPEDILLAAYAKINAWSTTGIKLAIRPCPDPTKGDIILVLDKSEIKELFALLGLVSVLLPEETLNKPIMDVIGDMIPPQYTAIAQIFLQGQTVKTILAKLSNELNSIPIEIGIYLHKSKPNQ